MRVVLFLVVCVVCSVRFVGTAASEAQKGDPAKGKPNPDRLKGMKAAVAEIEAGMLKQKFPPFPDSVQQRAYYELLKKECGVEAEAVREFAGKAGMEMAGYNDVMRVEIEHRFGAGILDKLMKKAQGKSLDEQLKQLKSSKAQERQQAAEELWVHFHVLSLRPDEKASVVVGLVENLKDQNVSVRSAAAHALSLFCAVVRGEAKQAIPALAEALGDVDPVVRAEVIGALGGIGADANTALPALVKAIKDPEPAIRSKTAWCLGAIDSDGKLVVPALAEALGDDKGKVRMEAAYALGTIGRKAEAAVPALKKATEDKFQQVRLAARLALWRTTGDEKQVRLALNEAAEEKAPFGALANSAALFERVGPAAVGLLVDNLQHPNAGVRSFVASTIGLIEPPAKQAVPALIQALKDPDPQVRESAGTALRVIDAEAARKAGVK